MATDLTASPQAPTELHRYVEALLANLAADGSTPLAVPTFPDDPGSWLPPAVQALVTILAGDDPLEPLTKAATRDQQSTALFLCLALAVAGHGDRIHASWLGTAFGSLSLDRPVTHGQRALWLAAARGAYGPAGKIFVLRKLDALAIPEHAEVSEWLQALAPGEPAVVVPAALVDFPELAEIPELARPVQAAARLARLRARCTEITSTRQADSESRTPLTNAAATPSTTWAEEEPLAVLRSMADLGGPPGPMGSLVSHLLDDLRPGADPYLAAIALHVAAPILRGVAEELAAATELTPPDAITVPVLGHDLVLHPEGPDAASMAAAEREIVADGVPDRGLPWLAYLSLALAVALCVAAVVLWWPLALLGVALAGLGGWQLWRLRQAKISDAAYVERRLAELKDLADGAVWALHAYAREAEDRAKQAKEDTTELTRLLRRGPRAA
ncbi:hypothetical protein ACFXJ8_19560 [Nonomuraea sp. NPDC059194]|uniref:hypothetical protein n=1 Tax=Nonomuraea sp. NPDC059194 TaxID=3346764 RepID=UPI0036CBB857